MERIQFFYFFSNVKHLKISFFSSEKEKRILPQLMEKNGIFTLNFSASVELCT